MLTGEPLFRHGERCDPPAGSGRNGKVGFALWQT
jgi:hypothetical protein